MGAHPDITPEAEEAERVSRALWDEHSERVRAARQQVRNHPAAYLFAQAETLRQSIDAIFIPNYVTLRSALISPTIDQGLAIELTQSASRALDKAASKGVIHANQAANKKSALAKGVNAL